MLPQIDSAGALMAKSENKLHRQLHIAALDIAVGCNTFHGPHEATADILRAWSNIEVRVVECIEQFTPKLKTIPLAQPNGAVDAGIYVPEAGTAKLVALCHVCGIWTKV